MFLHDKASRKQNHILQELLEDEVIKIKNILVFAPHPDDETLGCGGTIAKKLSEGYEIMIIILTDGRHAFSKVLGITFNPTPEELKRIRKEEAIKALKVLGVPKQT